LIPIEYLNHKVGLYAADLKGVSLCLLLKTINTIIVTAACYTGICQHSYSYFTGLFYYTGRLKKWCHCLCAFADWFAWFATWRMEIT